MTEPGATTNVATDSAQVGVQAGVVHGGVHLYEVSPGASPEEKFEKGVRCLDGRRPERARELIDEAIEDGHTVTNRVHFYWLLATVSGRTQRELSTDEKKRLWHAQNVHPLADDDEWVDGARAVRRLLESARTSEADTRVLLKEIEQLADTQRRLIPTHTADFLEGPIRDQLWDQILSSARDERMSGERVDRAWKFFHPDPYPPWRNLPRPVMIPATAWAQAVAGTIVCVTFVVHLGYLLVQAGRIWPLAGYLAGIAGGYVGARDGLEWRFRTVRLRVKDQQYRARAQPNSPPQGGFASGVDRQFDHYFSKFVPRHVDRGSWLAATAGIRRSIRDEIVAVYRPQRVRAEAISWLIRYRVGDVRSRWEHGTLWSYQRELTTPPRVKAGAVSCLAIFAAAAVLVVETAVKAAPLSAVRSTALALVGGLIAVRGWLHITLERRRYAADSGESEQAFAGDKAAFEKWKEKLADRPDDREMAAWLDCDRKVFLSEVLQHYKLTMSSVIAHAFIDAPAASTKRARVRNGPWRYTRYRLTVFLLTTDGVRQVSIQLDFQRGTFHDRKRINYRYDAVAALRVHHADNNEQKIDLELVNGNELDISVIGSGIEELLPDEIPGVVSEATLDAAGFHHALHILEGIAAEGKKWLAQQYRR